MLRYINIPGSQLYLRKPQHRAPHLGCDHRIVQQLALKEPTDAAVEFAGVHVMMMGDFRHHEPCTIRHRERCILVRGAHISACQPFPVDRPGNSEEDLVDHVNPG